jgi:hypothetical protein
MEPDPARVAIDATAELSDLRTAPEIVQAYVDRWWQVDQAYRRYCTGFEEHLTLDEVADTVRKLHRRYLEGTNKRFAVALESAQELEAIGLPAQRSFWAASNGGRRAILVLDAFRFDLARELEEKLRSAGRQVAVELSMLRAPLLSSTRVKGVLVGSAFRFRRPRAVDTCASPATLLNRCAMCCKRRTIISGQTCAAWVLTVT